MSTLEFPFPQSAFEYLAAAETKHWWFRARNSTIVWILGSRVCGIKSFLEVGCGTGFVISGIAKTFPSLELEASEYFEDGLVFARQRLPQCRFRQLDATAMAEENTYDCIGSFDVIEHIDADKTVLYNFHRALRTGGFLLLTVPQHPWLWSAADDYAHHVRRYTVQELRRKVLHAGFRRIFKSLSRAIAAKSNRRPAAIQNNSLRRKRLALGRVFMPKLLVEGSVTRSLFSAAVLGDSLVRAKPPILSMRLL